MCVGSERSLKCGEISGVFPAGARLAPLVPAKRGNGSLLTLFNFVSLRQAVAALGLCSSVVFDLPLISLCAFQ